MDPKTLLTLLKYQRSLLKEQLINKRKYRILELQYAKDNKDKRKQFLAQSIQSQMKKSMYQVQLEIVRIKKLLKEDFIKNKKVD